MEPRLARRSATTMKSYGSLSPPSKSFSYSASPPFTSPFWRSCWAFRLTATLRSTIRPHSRSQKNRTSCLPDPPIHFRHAGGMELLRARLGLAHPRLVLRVFRLSDREARDHRREGRGQGPRERGHTSASRRRVGRRRVFQKLRDRLFGRADAVRHPVFQNLIARKVLELQMVLGHVDQGVLDHEPHDLASDDWN